MASCESVNPTLTSNHQPYKPFLRWAGGKTWLLKQINEYIPEGGFNNYHEPFLGGGSVFFYLRPQGVSYLNDLNPHLIETYEAIRDNVQEVIHELSRFTNTEKCYYKVRDQNYKSQIKRAARFIYLNQTSFNGIYRENLQGQYNVPFGYRSKDFLDVDCLVKAREALQNVHFSSGDFSDCLTHIKRNDLVFLDPPYTITHNNNGFFKYNKNLFSEKDQYNLSSFIDLIKKKRAYYILTNAAHYKVREIFDKEDTIHTLRRASLIGGINAQRGRYEEYIFTNVTKNGK